MATTVDEILVRFLGDTTDFDRARTRFARGLQQIGRAGTMAGAAVTAGFGAIVGGSAAAAASLEQTSIAFEVLVGNIEKSKKLLKDMEQFAKISPFDVGEVEMAGKRLMAMGFAAKEIIPTLKDVGDITAGIGIGGGRFERIIHNLAQVRTQGKLTARELRDFAVNGVPLLDALATSIQGLSPNLLQARAQIHDMIRRGQISDMQVLRAFRRMASEGGKFADLMFKQSKTFLGMLSNIRDSLLITAREIGQVFLPSLKSVAKTVLELLDMFRAMDPTVKRIVAYVAVLGGIGGMGLGALSMAAIALGAAMLFLGPAVAVIKSLTFSLLAFNPIVSVTAALVIPLTLGLKTLGLAFVSLLMPILKIRVAFAAIGAGFASLKGVILGLNVVTISSKAVLLGLGTALLTLIKGPLKLLPLLLGAPFALLAPVIAAIVHPIGLLVIGITALTAIAFKTKNAFGGWADLFVAAKDAALSFAKNVVGFFWNIKENTQIIITWLSKNWRTTFSDIATFLVESLKLAGPVVVQNFLVVSKAILRMTAILFDSLSTMALDTWKYIWSQAFVDTAKKALVSLTLNHVIPCFIALRKAWDTWKFTPLDEWVDAASGSGGTLDRLENEWEEMWKNMKAITLAELKFDGPELNLDLDGLFKGVEDWKLEMNDLFEKPKNDAKEINKLLFKMSHYFGDKDFHISQQALDFGIQKAGMTPGVLNPEVDTAEYIGGGGIPMAGDKPMMGAFAGVSSMADILAMPDLPAGPDDEFVFKSPHATGFGTGLGVLQQPPTVGLIESTLGAASDAATTVLGTVDEAVGTAQTWFSSTTDWLNSTAEDIKKNAPSEEYLEWGMTSQEYKGTNIAQDFMNDMLYDANMDLSPEEYKLTNNPFFDGGINAPFPRGPLQGFTIGDIQRHDDKLGTFPGLQEIVDREYNKYAGMSEGSDLSTIDTEAEYEKFTEEANKALKKFIETHKEALLKHIAPPPGTSSYIDEKFYGITPGSVGPGSQYNPGNTGPVLGVTGGQFATYGPNTPEVIGGSAPNTYGGVPGLNSTLDADLGTMATNTMLSSILPSWLSPALSTLNPANATINAQSIPGQQQQDSDIVDRLDTLIDVTETNGPTAPNQVDELGIK